MSAEVLLIGATGMLGRAMAAELRRLGTNFEAPGRAELDLSDLARLDRMQAWRGLPPLIINCAAWTDVDGAEAHEAEATRINGDAVARLAMLAMLANMDSRLVTFSTDYVFSGESFAPYPTDAPRSPLNAYGRSKAAGEEALELRPMNWLNIRTSWLYAPWGKNFVRTMHALTHEKPLLKVVNDQRGRPTSAEHLARTTLDLVARDAQGHFHVTDGGQCTWFDFAREISRLGGGVGSSRVDLQACKLEYSIVSPK